MFNYRRSPVALAMIALLGLSACQKNFVPLQAGNKVSASESSGQGFIIQGDDGSSANDSNVDPNTGVEPIDLFNPLKVNTRIRDVDGSSLQTFERTPESKVSIFSASPATLPESAEALPEANTTTPYPFGTSPAATSPVGGANGDPAITVIEPGKIVTSPNIGMDQPKESAPSKPVSTAPVEVVTQPSQTGVTPVQEDPNSLIPAKRISKGPRLPEPPAPPALVLENKELDFISKAYRSVGEINVYDPIARVTYACSGTLTEGNVVYTAKHCFPEQLQKVGITCENVSFKIQNPIVPTQLDTMPCEEMVAMSADSVGEKNTLLPDIASFRVNAKSVSYPFLPIAKRSFAFKDYSSSPNDRLYALSTYPDFQVVRSCRFTPYASFLFDITGTNDPMIAADCDHDIISGNSGSGVMNSLGELVAVLKGNIPVQEGVSVLGERMMTATNIHYGLPANQNKGLIRPYVKREVYEKLSPSDLFQLRFSRYFKFETDDMDDDADFEFMPSQYKLSNEDAEKLRSSTPWRDPVQTRDELSFVVLIPKCFKQSKPLMKKDYHGKIFIGVSTDNGIAEDRYRFFPIQSKEASSIDLNLKDGKYSYVFKQKIKALKRVMQDKGEIQQCRASVQ